MSTERDDGDRSPAPDEGGAVVLELEGDAALLYDPENPDAWVRTDSPAGLDASA